MKCIQAKIPVFGVCLGHQILCTLLGLQVKKAPSGPAHGILSRVVHSGNKTGKVKSEISLFDQLPSGGFTVTRYHSLC